MTQYNLSRIAKLRANANYPVNSYDQSALEFYKRYKDSQFEAMEEKYADAFYYALSNITPVISDGELIVGKPMHTVDEQGKEELNKLKPFIDEFVTLYGQDSHMTIDYPLLLSKGTSGIVDYIETLKKGADEKKLLFYNCCQTCLRAVEKCAENYSIEAKRQSENCEDKVRKAELEKISAICAKVPKYPAESFYEAVQSVSFVTYCITFNPKRYPYAQQFQLGHPDRYLLPYYENDIKNGTLTKEEAQVLLDCLAIQVNHRVPHGLSSGFMVGGRLANGCIVANDLTEMGMQVVDDIRLVYPAVGYCYTKEHPKALLEKATEILSHGCSHPAIFNDDLISDGLLYYGVSEKESHEYIHSTCVEITPVASSAIWVASPYHNTPQYLLDLMDREYESIDELKKAYYKHLDEQVEIRFREQNEMRKKRMEKSFNPLLSCFVNDCLKNGKDIEWGGARYNWIMPSFVGLANLVDCFVAINKVVFEEKSLTICQLKKMLDNDFEGNEPIRQKLLNGIDKYGNDIPEVDALFNEITKHIVEYCNKFTDSKSNFHLVPSAFCWIMHEQFGKVTGATPDGRKAGFPLGDGSGACQGREHNGPTASILSATCWSHKLLIGGVAVNMKFSKKTFTDESRKKVEALIETYIDRGGFEIQINVVDKETLLKAQKNPEEYQDLVVRIGGYSDYFVKLSPEMQAEVILRTSHEI